MILDGGPTTGGLESTVLDATTLLPRLLRPGLIGPNELEAVLGLVIRVMPEPKTSAVVLPSPGLLKRHYSPQTPLECVEGDAWERVKEIAEQNRRVGWLSFGPPRPVPVSVFIGELPNDPAACSAGLYAWLHHLDKLGLARIVVELPPDSPEWLAVRDRLQRAAHG